MGFVQFIKALCVLGFALGSPLTVTRGKRVPQVSWLLNSNIILLSRCEASRLALLRGTGPVS